MGQSLQSSSSQSSPSPRPATPAAGGSWADLLYTAIESEILPCLRAAPLLAAPLPATPPPAALPPAPAATTLVGLLLADDTAAARRLVQLHAATPAHLLTTLLAPAAQYFGRLWERDDCTLMDVTIGVHQLELLFRECAGVAPAAVLPPPRPHRSACLLPAPGEQHRFGIAMVAAPFVTDGWEVHTGPALSGRDLIRLLRDQWFDVLGLSVSATRWLGHLATVLRAARATARNPHLLVMLGGPAIIADQQRARFLGADLIALDPWAALETCNARMAAPSAKSL